MSARAFGFGELLFLGIAAVPFYLNGTRPTVTLILTILGAFVAYWDNPMPQAKRLMFWGFLGGAGGTALVSILSRKFGYFFLVASTQMFWWSAWFAFFLAPLIISAVLVLRGVRPQGPEP